MRHAPVSRVPDETGARTALVLALLVLAPLGTGVPAPPPPFALVVIGGACRLAPEGAGPPCPCAAIPGTLRRALGWPLPLADDRERRGPFGDPAALDRVPGLGLALVARLRPLLVAGGDDPACALAR